MDTPTTAALLAELESLLIDAGETCPSDYQSGFDWDRYNQMIDAVKQLFIEHCSAPGAKSLTPTEQHTLWFDGHPITLRIKSGPLK